VNQLVKLVMEQIRASSIAKIDIGGRLVGQGHPVFIIAEAGANHNGDLSLAKEMVVAAREAGADCIKFQTFTAEEFCADKAKTFSYLSQGKRVSESEFKMFKRLEFKRDEWVELMSFCAEQSILFLTTIQDPVNLHMMLDLGLMGIKVGSDDFDHLVNLRKYATTGLPLIISKGMADQVEVDHVIGSLRPLARGGLAVLHCVSLYPTDVGQLNLRQLKVLQQRYPDVVWGFSDHSPSTLAPALAVALGASIIEKHFTLDHDLPGPDHWFSMDPRQFAEMVLNIRFAEQALGDGVVRPHNDELASKKIMRRRILARIKLEPGATIDEDAVVFKRGEHGAYAGEWGKLNGGKLLVAKQPNEPIYPSELSQ
jgi:N,N'-diacetyllegionaminate synthase